jgi:HD-like signal output (HDOD) protein
MATLQETNTQPGSAAKEVKTEWRNVRLEVLEKIEDLPSFSSVVMEFMELTRQEFFSAKDFEAVICKDQALVARLLKVANCGLYGRSRTIRSIPEAVVLIGLDNLKRIVYAVSSQGLMTKQMTHYGYHEKQGFWVHAMATGQAAKVLADACPDAGVRAEEIFVAGLLHDVGKLVLDGFLGERPHKQVSREMEISAVGLDHGELAGHILKQWNIPLSITAPISHHHDFRNGGEHRKAAAILALARGVCREWKVGVQSPLDLSWEVPHDKFAEEMDEIGLTADRWPGVVWNIQQSLAGLEDLFERM